MADKRLNTLSIQKNERFNVKNITDVVIMNYGTDEVIMVHNGIKIPLPPKNLTVNIPYGYKLSVNNGSFDFDVNFLIPAVGNIIIQYFNQIQC